MNGWQRCVFSFSTHPLKSAWRLNEDINTWTTSPELFWVTSWAFHHLIWVKLFSYHITQKCKGIHGNRQNKSPGFVTTLQQKYLFSRMYILLLKLWRKKKEKLRNDRTTFLTCLNLNSQFPLCIQAHSPNCLKSSVKFLQSVMIWGAMSSAGVGPLCFFFKTNVTARIYQEILEHFMLLSADQLFKDANFIFQQDLAPAHTTKSTKSWLNDHGVGVLDWPANSPDLNPIENLWGIVKRKMRNKRPKKFN